MKYRLLCTSLFAIFSCNYCLCQHKLMGYVKDKRGLPIKHVNVQVKDSYDGSSTDSLGYFTFMPHECGNKRLSFSHINYIPVELEVNLDSCSEKPIDVTLRDKILSLDEVVITSSIGYSKSKSVAINKMDVYTNPHAGGDLALALRTTPGLQNIDNKEGFFVRGGNSDETVVSINGVVVDNFFTPGISNIAGRSRFETGLFKGMNFSTGDIPVEYGNAMSGSLELKIDDMPENNLYGFGLSPIYVTANAGKLFSENSSYIECAVTYSNPKLYYPMFLKKGWEFVNNNNGVTGTVRFQKKFKNSSRLTLLSSIGNDNKGISNLYDSVTVKNKIENLTLINILDYQLFIGSRTKLNFSAGYSSEKNNKTVDIIDYATILNDTTKNNFFQLHAKGSTDVGSLRLLYGLDYFNQKQSYNIKRFNDQTFAAYISSTLKIGHTPFLINAGLREEYSHYYDKWVFLPRGILSYIINNKNSLSFGVGLYNQTENIFINYGITPIDKSKSTQYNLTYQFKATVDRLLRIQAYAKRYHKLMEMNHINADYIVSNNGHGYANGIDFFWKDAQSIRNLDYSLSYSYLDSKRNYLYGNHYVLPVFASKHNASCVIKYYVPSISSQFAISFSYRSHMPYLIKENNIIKYIPDAFSSDISYNYLFNIKKIRGVLSFSVPNIFNNNSIVGYQLNGKGAIENVSYPNKQTFFVSLFLNFGVDRRSEIINSLIKY